MGNFNEVIPSVIHFTNILNISYRTEIYSRSQLKPELKIKNTEIKNENPR